GELPPGAGPQEPALEPAIAGDRPAADRSRGGADLRDRIVHARSTPVARRSRDRGSSLPAPARRTPRWRPPLRATDLRLIEAAVAPAFGTASFTHARRRWPGGAATGGAPSRRRARVRPCSPAEAASLPPTPPGGTPPATAPPVQVRSACVNDARSLTWRCSVACHCRGPRGGFLRGRARTRPSASFMPGPEPMSGAVAGGCLWRK